MNKRSWLAMVGLLAVSNLSTPNPTSARPRPVPTLQNAKPSAPALTLASSKIDTPTAQAWSGHNEWNEDKEIAYSRFIATLGERIAENRCRTLAACLNDPAINPLPEAFSHGLRFRADCADVPYILRAYFSYVHDLPFRFTKEMTGRGRDARYYRDALPKGVRFWHEFATPRKLLEGLSSAVHSGFFRSAHSVEDSDFYQTTVSRQAIHPGTMFYDPNGHVLVVYGLRADGQVLTFDGHPDGFLTHGTLSEKNERGGESQGGGFKNFRPLRKENNLLAVQRNHALADFGGGMQFEKSRYIVDGQSVSYHHWVRSQLQEKTAQRTSL